MFNNNNWNRNSWWRVPLPPPSLKKVKFNQNQPMNEEIDVFEGRGGGGGRPLIINFYLNYYWWTYKNVMFQISSKSGSKWRILLLGGQNFFWGSQGGQSGLISKNLKILIQNGGLNPQPKFQHSSWIRKCLEIRDFWGGFRPPHRGWVVQFQNFEKSLIQNSGLNLQPKSLHPRSIRKCLKPI